MKRKKSLNDIRAQFDRCKILNWNISENGGRDRLYGILQAAQNARINRSLSKFDKDRDFKKGYETE